MLSKYWKKGYLPLLVACSKKNVQNVELIQLLVFEWPHAVQIALPTIGDKLPLHMACESRAHLTVIQALTDTWPDSCHVQDDKGFFSHPHDKDLVHGKTKMVKNLAESCLETLPVTVLQQQLSIFTLELLEKDVSKHHTIFSWTGSRGSQSSCLPGISSFAYWLLKQ